MAAYGGLYDNTTQTLSLTGNTPEQIGLPNTMPAESLTYAAGNTITIPEDGNYEISYSAIAALSDDAMLTLSVRKNGEDIPGTIVNQSLTTNVEKAFQNDVIVALNAGDVIDLAATASDTAEATLNSVALTVKELTTTTTAD